MLFRDYPELSGELSNRLAGLFKELLGQERRSVTGVSDDRQRELLEKIERWEKTFHWARWEMIKDGLLKPDSPRGTWEISEKGRTLLSSLAAKEPRH